MTTALARLKQRKLVQWTVAYVAFAFALLQGVDIVAQRFGWPDAIERWLILALAIGFCFALVLAWYHGERGMQRIGGTELAILAVLLALGGGLLWRFGRAGALPSAGISAPQADATMRPLPASLAQAAPVPSKSVAVLPLSNESGDQGQQYFSDGLSEDLITALSQFAGLKVISRNSSFQFRDSKQSSAAIGRVLGVAHLLEGSVQRLGEQVRISAELVNAADGSTVWSQHYDRPYKDLFTLQDDITKAVAAALKARLLDGNGAVAQSDRPPSGSLTAYNAYLQGAFHGKRLNDADLRSAIGFFQQAIALDPHYALAYARLGGAQLVWAGNFLQSPKRQQEARDAARSSMDKALTLEPDLAAAHTLRGFYLANMAFDWSGAEKEIRRALQLDPHNAGALLFLGILRAGQGEVAQGLALLRQSESTDPLCTVCYDYQARFLPGLGRYDEALRAANKAIEIQPEFDFARVQIIYIDLMRGDSASALRQAQQVRSSNYRDMAMAFALQGGPDRAAADATLHRLIATQGGSAAYQIADVYALRKQPDAMFAWLERARVNRDPGLQLLLSDSPILRYKDDPRFAAFCRKVGLPTTTDARAMR